MLSDHKHSQTLLVQTHTHTLENMFTRHGVRTQDCPMSLRALNTNPYYLEYSFGAKHIPSCMFGNLLAPKL